MDKKLSLVIISDDSSIQTAIESINKNGVRGVFICNVNNECLGIVMDSDIRRALLHEFDMYASVKTIMNTSPFVIGNDVSQTERKRRLVESNKVLVPIVDNRNRVVDYLYLPDILYDVAGKESPKDNGSSFPEKILIIGGAGYIGSFLVDKLLKEGFKIRVLDLLLYGKEPISMFLEDPGFEFIRGDCRDEKTLSNVLDNIDTVIHLGEIVGDQACKINESVTIDINYSASHKIVDQCLKSNVRRFIFTSSCSVYGSSEHEVNEESELNPVSLYARCKIESEKVVLTYDYDHFYPTVLRLSTVHGLSYRQRFDLVVNLLTIKALVDKKIDIFGGNQWRPFLSVSDVCEGILSVLRSPCEKIKNQIFNLGDSLENYKLLDVGMIIQNLLPEVDVKIIEDQADKRNYHVNFDKIMQTLEFKAKKKVIDSIKDIIYAYREDRNFSSYNDSRFHNHFSLK